MSYPSDDTPGTPVAYWDPSWRRWYAQRPDGSTYWLDGPPGGAVGRNPYGQPAPQWVSGISTGGHIAHGLVTVLTAGLWAPFWWLAWRLRRQKIGY